MSTDAKKTVRLQQMLHGYSGGHRLLSTSRTLSKPGERQARTMSDLSGASFKAGFDGYLTGYPLEEDKLFAIAKTWFAKDQPRPGCVWTHTLLISFEELGHFEAFEELLAAFRHPSGEDLKEYSQPLSLPASGGKVKAAEPIENVAEVIQAVYSHPNDIIALPAKNAEHHTRLILALWQQQWPSLRSNFSFCTGALELRTGENRLDVQAIPDERRLMQKAINKALLVGVDEVSTSIASREWITAATNDLIEDTEGSLKKFVACYADPEHRSRADFQHYAVSFSKLNSEATLTEVVSTLAAVFPKSSEAQALKAAVVGPQKTRPFFKEANDSEILRGLLLSDETASTFDLSSLAISERFADLWTQQEEQAWHLLVDVANSERPESAEYLTDAVAHVVNKDSIARMATERCDLTALVVKNNPSLGVVSEVWRCTGLSPSSLGSDFIDQATANGDFARSIMGAWIVANRPDCAKELAGVIGPDIASLILSLEPATLSLLDRQAKEWHTLLRDTSEYNRHWLLTQYEASAEAACLVVSSLNLRRDRLDAGLLDAWNRAYSGTPDLTRRTLCLTYVTMLAIAFDNAAQHVSESVVSKCFPPVYEAAMQSNLADRHWDALQMRLPQSGLWWDRCKKLRMGLLDYCVKNNWSVDTFIRCTSAGFAFEQVLGSWGLDHAEKAFLSQAVDKIIRGDIEANMDQRRAADSYSYWLT